MPGSKKRYPNILTDRELLKLVGTSHTDWKPYYVDLQAGEVYTCKNRKQLKYTYPPTQPGLGEARTKRKFVAIYNIRRRAKRVIAVNRLIWIIGAKRPIPKNFEVHHIDDDNEHDWYDNLLCTFKDDHKKLHRVREARNAETPF